MSAADQPERAADLGLRVGTVPPRDLRRGADGQLPRRRRRARTTCSRGSSRATALYFLQTAVPVACVFSILTIFPTGDLNGSAITEYQPTKLAAAEGLFISERGAPLAIIGMPDEQHQTLIDPIVVPGVLSFLAYGNFHAEVKGIAAYPVRDRPPVALTYYAYHVMVGLGTIFVALGALAALAAVHETARAQPLGPVAADADDAVSVHRE